MVTPAEANDTPIPGKDYPIVLFDGMCHLCDRSVQFVLDRDRKGQFHFAPLQSALGRDLLRRYELPVDTLDTMVLIENDRSHTRSSAALRVAAGLTYPWKTWVLFLAIPKTIRDAVYNIVARNRYRWFGQRETCKVPEPEWVSRFHE